jgi:molecular chaperone GrpE
MSDAPGPGQQPSAGSGGLAEDDENVARLEARVEDLADQRLRALAELENARKRYDRELGQARAQERIRVTREWLPVLDNLERALAHSDADPESIIGGVRAVTDQAVELVSRLGFPRQDDLGETFDPSRHDAVSARADSDAPDGTVVEVLQPAYGEGDRQLRPALVVVAKGDLWRPPVTSTRSWACHGQRAKTRSSAPIASSPASTIRTSARIRAPRRRSSRPPKLTTCYLTQTPGSDTTPSDLTSAG